MDEFMGVLPVVQVTTPKTGDKRIKEEIKALILVGNHKNVFYS